MSEKYIEVEENYEELVAVIAAALAIQLGVDIPDINIQSIRRIPNSTPTWRTIGKQHQMLGKF